MEGRKEFGGSLPVDNVQELASRDLKHVPHRYIRLDLDPITVDNESLRIPVIDMAKLCDQQSLEMAALHQACGDWGFFQVNSRTNIIRQIIRLINRVGLDCKQLINHGAAEVIEETKAVVGEFFKLPLEEKMGCAQTPNGIEGYGQAFVVSEDQKLDWGDMLFIMTLPVSLRNSRFWPNSPPNFRYIHPEWHL